MKVTEAFPDRVVCILGLGYVGLTLAAVMADVGFRVIGIEIRDDLRALLKAGTPYLHEVGLADMLRRMNRGGNFEMHKHIPEACDASVYIITVGTPLAADGRARLDMVENVTREVARQVEDGDLVVMRSTVKLGTTRRMVRPILRQTGRAVDLAFCPERTQEGRALTELRELPQIIGASSSDAALRASQLFQFLTRTIMQVSDFETAEMIKLVDNAQRDVFFALANEVAEMCDSVGISAAEVINAGKLGYPRTNLPMPGPVGGPCLSKDSHILAESFRELGAVPEIILAARATNERQPEKVVAHLDDLTGNWPDFPAKPVIVLAGLAFKGRPENSDLRGTMAVPVLEALRRHFPGATLRGFDPVVALAQIADLGLEPVADLDAAMNGANLVLLLNNHRKFEEMPINDLVELLARPGLIYDFWNNFTADELSLPEGTGYMTLGSHGRAVLPRSTRPVPSKPTI